MNSAAGIIFRCDGKILLCRRGPDGDHPNEWAFPGGKIESGETPREAAIREVLEECGYQHDGNLTQLTDLEFVAFGADIDTSFEPKLNFENTDSGWFTPDALPSPMHPVAEAIIESPEFERMGMNETEIAIAIRDGELPSPQNFDNMSLFAVRITGTGTAYRTKFDEYTYRPPENYLNDAFLARCNGLPVIFEHPADGSLDSDEYHERNVGSIMLPYIQDDEVWGIARIYDESAIQIMSNEQMSTSPSVVFHNPDVNSTMRLDDDTEILIEGKPSLLDHLAICESGVWDKGRSPAGVKVDKLGDPNMEEVKKPDAEGANLEAMEKADDSKMDQMLALLTKLVSAQATKPDAIVPENLPTEPMATAADTDIGYMSKADGDALRSQVAELAGRQPRERADGEEAELADSQARADSVANSFGERAPAPLIGESPFAYRQRMAARFKKHSKTYADMNIASINDPKLFGVIEAQIYSDAQAAAMSPCDVPQHTLREVIKTDATGRRITSFVGDPAACWDSFKSPSRRRLEIGRAHV